MLIVGEVVHVWGQEVYGISLCPKSKIIFLNEVYSERKKKVKHKLCNMLTLGNTGFWVYWNSLYNVSKSCYIILEPF